MRFPRPVIAASLAAVLATAGCSDAPGPTGMVLVTLDTTRADRIGIYGDPGARTPVLDAWARGGTVVRDVIADVPLTLPSHVTILTGIPCLAHGVRTNEGARLGEGAVTLAERLRARGWRTGAVVSSRVLASETGVAQGFERFDDAIDPYVVANPTLFPTHRHWAPAADRRADRAVGAAMNWLGTLREGDRFLLWLHLYDAHFPYDPPAPWLAVDGNAYRGEVHFADASLRRLDRALAGRDDAGRVIVAVVADHGEGLEDHGEAEHGLFLYDETVRVPFLVRGAGVPAGRVLDAQVRTIDVGGTLLELAGDEGPPLGLGESLVPELRGSRVTTDRPAYSETILPKVSWGGAAPKALRAGGAKYVLAPRPELYDVRSDPGERDDLARARPARAAAQRAVLEETIRDLLASDSFVAEPDERDEADREALRALGYVRGAASPAMPEAVSELSVDGFDPKDLVDVALAGRDVENGFHDAAERKLARFLAGPAARDEDPAPAELVSLAYQNLGAIAMARGRFDAAAESYRAAIGAHARNAEARAALPFALNRAGRSAEAEREAARLLAETPDVPRLRLHRALALARLGRRGEARAELERVAGTARDAAEREIARAYAERLGTADEERWLRAYLESGGGAGEGP